MKQLGLVVARHRRHVVVESSDGATHVCHSATRSIRPLVGDRVAWQVEGAGTGIVTDVEPRTTVLRRIDSRGRPQAIAANLTQLVVVIAAEPEIDWLVLDHYLVAAELSGLRPLIVFNKTDIAPFPPQELDIYSDIATIYRTSAAQHDIDPGLLDCLAGARSALVGQSGVGKSSLLNALLGESRQSVGELSEKLRQGKHTTTGSALYRLANGAELVDSPGVRRFAPYIEHEDDVAAGFREFQKFIPNCRFADCKHLAEPNCAVKAATTAGIIAQRRYDNYRNLRALVEELRLRRES